MRTSIVISATFGVAFFAALIAHVALQIPAVRPLDRERFA